MAKVVLAWELGGGAGHCAKLAPIANGLVARGHDVWIAVRELVTARHIFGSTKINFFQAPFLGVRPPNPIAQTRSLAHILHNVGFGDSTSLEVLCAAWRSIFTAVKPDMIICDHAPLALLASRWHGVRRVVVGTGFTVPPIVSPFPNLRYWMPASDDELRRDEEVVLGRVNKMLTGDGLRPLNALAGLYADVDLSFLLTFQELDHYPQRGEAKYWGAWSLSGGSTPAWPDGNRRIFAYLKPPAANWKLGEFLNCLRESRLPTVVYVAGGDPRWLSKFQTQQLLIASKLIDIAQVARHCDVAILNGTAGSVAAMLLAGVPQLNFPLFLEQLILSRRVADLGAGLCANPTQPQQMSACLMEVLQNDRYRDAAQAFAHRYAEFDPLRTIDQIVLTVHELLLN